MFLILPSWPPWNRWTSVAPAIAPGPTSWKAACKGSPRYAFNLTVLNSAAVGERVTRGLPVSPATTHTSRWCRTSAPTIIAASAVTFHLRTQRLRLAIPPHHALAAQKIAPPVTCPNMKSPAPMPDSRIIEFASFGPTNNTRSSNTVWDGLNEVCL